MSRFVKLRRLISYIYKLPLLIFFIISAKCKKIILLIKNHHIWCTKLIYLKKMVIHIIFVSLLLSPKNWNFIVPLTKNTKIFYLSKEHKEIKISHKSKVEGWQIMLLKGSEVFLFWLSVVYITKLFYLINHFLMVWNIYT